MEFYKKNAYDFSATRHSVWKSVQDFGVSFDNNSKVLDAGCGNGKNIDFYKSKTNIVGIDNCRKFVTICNEKGHIVKEGSILEIPYPDNEFDFIMCIAVIHHLKNKTERINAVKELLRVLKPGGDLLITVWALESDEFSKKRRFVIGDNIVPFKKENRYYYIHDKTSFVNFCNNFNIKNNKIFWEKGNWNAVLKK